MDKTINKIVMVGFVCAAFLVGYTVQVMNTLLTNSWGAYARVMRSDMIAHGAPIALGLAFFLYLVLSKSVRLWANEVVVEVSKVVWPSRKDTTAMTIFVCFFMLISGLVLGFFDFISSQVIQFIIDLN